MADKSDKVNVAVRLRPLNKREMEMNTPIVVDIEKNQTLLYPVQPLQRCDDDARNSIKTFAFDHCFWSVDPSNPKYASQETVFECLGKGVMDNAFRGYNACIFAYGQTGSGKSYTMMGSHDTKGIIPRLCDALFERISAFAQVDVSTQYKVEVSYMEIYNEKVHDLLDVQGHKKHLRVREHAILGPYVDGLSQLVVNSYEDIDKLMNEGNKSRTVAATNMNSESSRSHAVFNIRLTQTVFDAESGVSGEKVSKISLVDLAGSERAQKTGAVGERLREGCNINRSLTTLMLVISALAESSAGPSVTAGHGKSTKDKSSSSQSTGQSQNASSTRFVPYRDSVLTWLLKDNLGGNSKTVMVATLSPAADNYEETLSTLRYADRAKRIVNHAKVNEDPNSKLIMELRSEVDRLRNELETAKERQTPHLKEKLEESEKLVKQLTKTWEEKLLETERIHKERHEALEKMGISVQTSGIKVEKNKFYMVNLNADPSLNELLVYYLKERTRVGSDSSNDIQLHGLGIMKEHCELEILNNEVYITPYENARTLINGHAAKEKLCLRHGDRILWGTNHFFRLNCPKPPGATPVACHIPVDTSVDSNLADYSYAQEEVMLAELNDDPIKQVVQDLEKHHANEKEVALARQRQEYEQQLEMLKSQLVPSSHSAALMSASWHSTEQQHAMMMQAQAFAAHQYSHMPPLVGTPGDPNMGASMPGYSIPPIMWASSMAALSGVGSNSASATSFIPGGLPVDNGIALSGLSALTGGGVPGVSGVGFVSPMSVSMSCQDVQSERHQEWVQEREKLMKQSLVRLREQVAKANALVREANFLSSELRKCTEYSVTLQIPASHLSPNGKKSGVAIEPTILVKRTGKPNQLWAMEKFENKIIDMREYYEDYTENQQQQDSETAITQTQDGKDKNEMERDDPFFDVQEDHTLIGVANMYLRCVFYDAPFRYRVPIINQQGEIAGKLLMELSRSSGDLPDPQTLTMNGSQLMWNGGGTGAGPIPASVLKNGYPQVLGSLSSSASHGNLSTALKASSTTTALATSTPMKRNTDGVEEAHITASRSESGYSLSGSSSNHSGSRQVAIRVRILQATQLPDKLANFVFCQYHFWGEKDMTVVPPPLQPDFQRRRGDCVSYKFAHEAEYVVTITDDFLEHLAEDALSVEIYGHRTLHLPTYADSLFLDNGSSTFESSGRPGSSVVAAETSSLLNSEAYDSHSVSSAQTEDGSSMNVLTMPLLHQPLNSSTRDMRRFAERWAELYRRLEYWVAIEELNDDGNYEKVDVMNAPDVACGGVYQLRHGQSRRVRVVIRPNKVHRGKGSLPLVCDSIREIHMGSIMTRPRQADTTLDSYQDSDLNFLRDCWSDAVHKRQTHLQEQLQKIVNLPGKTAADEEREQSLMNQWMRLTDERNAVTFPEPGSGIPGAPASWNPPSCMEKHCPVIFLNINVDQVTSSSGTQHVSVLDTNPTTASSPTGGSGSTSGTTNSAGSPAVIGVAGVNCRLTLEEETQRQQHFQRLEIVKRYETVLGAVASWDASRHEQLHLNRVTPNNERVYMIVKTTVRLSHPICVDLILRKRIAVNIYKPASSSWTGSFKKQMNKLFSTDTAPVYWTGVTFQIVSSIPQASLELEERESMAQMAASQGEHSVNTGDNESYIEKYLRTVSALDSSLQLDRSRQEIALKEILAGFRRQQQAAQRIMLQPPSGVATGPRGSLFESGTGGGFLALNGKSDLASLAAGAAGHERARTTEAHLQDAFRGVGGGSSGVGMTLGGIRKYISVPNLQGLSQSLNHAATMNNNSAVDADSATGRRDFTSTHAIQEESSEHSDLSTGAVADPNNVQNKMRKRPEPPKALLMAAKHPLISPLATQSVSASAFHQQQAVLANPIPVPNMSLSKSSTLQPLSEEGHYHPPMPEDTSLLPFQSRHPLSTATSMNNNNRQVAFPLLPSSSSTSALSSVMRTQRRDETDVSVFEPLEAHSQEITHLIPMKPRYSTDESASNPIRKNPFASNDEPSQTSNWMEELGSSCYNISDLLDNGPVSNCGTLPANPSVTNQIPSPTASTANLATNSSSVPSWLRLDSVVEVVSSGGDAASQHDKKTGVVKFVGGTQFAPGIWVGVQLHAKEGRNDGTIQGVRYFNCPQGHGIFIRADKLRPL